MEEFIEFKDHLVPYKTLVRDLAAEVVSMMKNDECDPIYVSQRMAYKMFGRGNVDRWRREGNIEPCFRPGKVEYKTSELRFLQRKNQDYL